MTLLLHRLQASLIDLGFNHFVRMLLLLWFPLAIKLTLFCPSYPFPRNCQLFVRKQKQLLHI